VDNSVGKLAILVDKYLLPSKLSVEKIFWLWRKLFLLISLFDASKKPSVLPEGFKCNCLITYLKPHLLAHLPQPEIQVQS
jgi:hypothetical protein